MNKDFRVNVDFIGHPKTLRLIRRFDHEALSYILRLWSYTAKYFPDGVFRDQDEEDLEIALGWKGEPGELIEALCDRKTLFLEKDDDGYYMRSMIGSCTTAGPLTRMSARRTPERRRRPSGRRNNPLKMRKVCAAHAPRNAPSMRSAMRRAMRKAKKILRGAMPPLPLPLPLPLPYPIPLLIPNQHLRLRIAENCEVGRGGKPKVVSIQKGAPKKKPPDERMPLTEALGALLPGVLPPQAGPGERHQPGKTAEADRAVSEGEAFEGFRDRRRRGIRSRLTT